MLAVRQEEGVGGVVLAVRQEEREGKSCACRWARGGKRGEELYLPLGKRREKRGVVFVR